MNENLTFKQWLAELAGTGAIFDPKAKGEFNWWGAPGSTGKVIEGDPIKNSKKKKKKKK
ncbi:MAG: hypothetical protein ACW99G_01410 [Candidatus Thorarchaeota archaeon]|jgi:hypothetical protein